MGEIRYINFSNGNTATAFNNVFLEQNTEIISSPKPKRQKVAGSGRKKNVRKKAEPIRNPEQLKKMRTFFYDKYLRTNNVSMKYKHLRNHTIFIVGTQTGLRMSDLLRLTWADILSEDKFSIIEQKTKKIKNINITSGLKHTIQEFKTFYESNGMEIIIDNSVFLEKKRSEIKDKDDPDIENAEKAYTKVLKEAAKKIGIKENMGTHSLRKTYSYWFLLNHKSDTYAMNRLQESLNHSDQKTTLKYAGFSDEQYRKDAEDMDRLYDDIDNGIVKLYDDKITVSKGQVEDLLRYAYSLGKKPVMDFNTDVDNLAALNGMLADLEL